MAPERLEQSPKPIPKARFNIWKVVALSVIFLVFIAQLLWSSEIHASDRQQIVSEFSAPDEDIQQIADRDVSSRPASPKKDSGPIIARQNNHVASNTTLLVKASHTGAPRGDRVQDNSCRYRFSCSTTRDWNIPYIKWLYRNARDEEVMCAAHRRSMRPRAPGKPRIAFLFMTRGAMPLEPLWRRFFANHKDSYSLYVHASTRKFRFKKTSLFYRREIPSKAVDRFGITFSEAVRRLVAYALLDHTMANEWFTVICESSIPIRPFPFVYDYIMKSKLSYVESFVFKGSSRNVFVDRRKCAVSRDQVRKGEPWVTLNRRHAGMLVGDNVIFPKFKSNWHVAGVPSEHYMPTLFHVTDELGIANRSLLYVNWSHGTRGTHPFAYDATKLTRTEIKRIQKQTRNSDGFYLHSDGIQRMGNQPSCVYNGVANSPCYLFARKFSASRKDVEWFMRVVPPAIRDAAS